MKYLVSLFLFSLLVVGDLMGASDTTVHVQYSGQNWNEKKISTFKMISENKGAPFSRYESVWATEKDCECKVDVFVDKGEKPEPLFTCLWDDKKSQVAVNCGLHDDKEKGLYFFACSTNYLIWCSD